MSADQDLAGTARGPRRRVHGASTDRPARARRWRPLRPLLPVLLCLAAAGCVVLPSQPVGTSVEAERAEQLYRDGELARSAEAFLDLARQHRGDANAHYRLRAAEALRDRGDLEAASRALGDIRRRRLHGDEPVRLDLLDAEIALSRGDTERALALLAQPAEELPQPLQLRALELRARASLAGGDAFASAQARAGLDRWLEGADREANRRELLDALAAIEPQRLRDRSNDLAPEDPLWPWIEQALRGAGQPLARRMPRPSHPVGTLRPGADGALAAEGYQRLQRIALLLPAGSQLAGVSRSIRDGFLAAYFADDPANRPELRIYDSGSTPASAVAAYGRAVADGADHVVGPLQRESVGELFHQALPARVLALNHPDTGEVPPPGSAEFGLLPDVEGAQVAEHMRERGITRAAVIAADTDWAERAARAFRAQFEAGGGIVAGETRLPEREVDFTTAILQATGTLGSDAATGVFISLRPQQARLLVPQLRVAQVLAPVYGTSHIYAGDDNAALDRDLDGVEFCDAPWLFGPVPGRPTRGAIAARIDSANGFGGRLFAFGMDAYVLLPYLDWLLTHPDAYLTGATGELTADGFGRIHRMVGWARFDNGIARPVDGALSSAPTP